ncbi:MAG: hypothetical protein R6W89_06250 [Candidatus Hydrogenedentota bacterium]
MQSILNIVCPHCQAKGQVAAPPTGAMVIGPCPQCNELVMVFSGAALPLKKDILMNGSAEDKRQHLMEVLTTFLDRQISRLVQELENEGGSDDDQSELDAESEGGFDMHSEENLYEEEETSLEGFESEETPEGGGSRHGGSNAISQREFEDFVRNTLPLLDKRDYFRKTFDNG